MKQILILLLTGLLFSHCAPGHSDSFYRDSEQNHPAKKMYPSIIISPSQSVNDYYRDANGQIRQNEDQGYLMNIDTSDLYYRMLKRNRNLPQNKFAREIKNEKLW